MNLHSLGGLVAVVSLVATPALGNDLSRVHEEVHALAQTGSAAGPLMSIWNPLNATSPCPGLETTEWYFAPSKPSSPDSIAVIVRANPIKRDGKCGFAYERKEARKDSVHGKLWPFGITIRDFNVPALADVELSFAEARAAIASQTSLFTQKSGTTLITGLPPMQIGALYYAASGLLCAGTARESSALLVVNARTGAVQHNARTLPASCE